MTFEIYTDYGPFKNIQSAANSEKQINWWDDTDTNQIFCTESFAVVEIRDHLKKAGLSYSGDRSSGKERDRSSGKERDRSSGKERDRSSGKERDRSDLRIFVGKSVIDEYGFIIPAAGHDGAYKSFLTNDGWIVLIWGNHCHDTLRASYDWLQSIGFRWYTPDIYGTHIPDTINLTDSECSINYDYTTRGCYNEFVDDSHPDFLDWAARNGMNMLRVQHFLNPYAVKKRGLQIMSGGHDIFYKFLNPNSIYPYQLKNIKTQECTYYDIHPEWFALIDGKRSSRDENLKATEGYYTGDNICTSNLTGVSELAKNLLVSLNEGDYRYCDYLNLWAYDNGSWCECDECLKLGNLSRRMLLLAYHMNKILKNAYDTGNIHRRLKLVVPIYHETLEPPDKPLPIDFDYEHIISTFFPIERCYAHNIDDTKCTETNAQLNELYKKWADRNIGNYKGDIFIGEYYNVSSFASLPFVFVNRMSNDIPYYFKTGTRHLYYMHISVKNWGILLLNNCILAGYLKSIEFDQVEFLIELYENYYPQSGQLMRQFHDFLEKASQNMKYLKHYQFAADGRKLSLIGEIEKEDKFPLSHCKYDFTTDDSNNSISFTQTMKYFERASEVLSRAYKKSDDKERKRIEIEVMRFDYGFNVMKFIFYYVQLRYAYKKNDKNEIAVLYSKTEALRQELIKIEKPLEEMKYECPWYDNAYKATWHEKSYELLRKEIEKLLH